MVSVQFFHLVSVNCVSVVVGVADDLWPLCFSPFIKHVVPFNVLCQGPKIVRLKEGCFY